jgi:LPXTG-motif cell wall-anchored protein
MFSKKKFYKNLAIASFVWAIILLLLKIMGYHDLSSSETPLFLFIILESLFLLGGFYLFFKSKKL